MIVWIIGLAGSGKSTVAREVYEKWKETDPATVLVDGDEIREIFRHDRGDQAYSLEGRRINAKRIAELCAWLDRHNINVVCAILSIFEETREWNRQTYEKYLEVYLHASDETLAQRRHLYNEARQGKIRNVVGVDIPFTPPRNSDMTFSTEPQINDVEKISNLIFERITGAK